MSDIDLPAKSISSAIETIKLRFDAVVREKELAEQEKCALEGAIDDAQSEIDRLTGNFSFALQALRANRIEHALFELEKALPDEFIGFAETIVKWSKKA